MKDQYASIYQSGQTVPVEGWYEVVGGTPGPRQSGKAANAVKLTTHDMFPNYDGRAICWHFLGQKPDAPARFSDGPDPRSTMRSNMHDA